MSGAVLTTVRWALVVVLVPLGDVVGVGLFGFAGASGEGAAAVADGERAALVPVRVAEGGPDPDNLEGVGELDGAGDV